MIQKDADLIRIEAQQNLLNKLHTDNKDIELETSSLNKHEMVLISKMKAIDELVKQVYGNDDFVLYEVFTKPYLRSKFSDNRKSRAEIIKGVKALNGENNDVSDSDHKYKNGIVSRIFNR